MSLAAAPTAWAARLELKFQSREGRTRLVGRRHSGPLLVQRAFYPETGVAETGANPAGPMAEPCHTYVLHPPGGVASGDRLEVDVTVGERAHALLTTPAAGKFYRRGGAGAARLTQSLTVDDGVLEWLPQENIFYPDAVVELCSTVRLGAGARFVGWEIACLGLPVQGRDLEGGELRQSMELWREERPLVIERVRIDRECLAARWGLAGRNSLGTWMAYPATPASLEIARASLPKSCAGMSAACTLVDGVLICRAHGMRADRLKEVFVGLWRALRPTLLGRAAVPPRIWNT